METNMDSAAAVAALGALAQEHRITLFQLLMQAGEEGMRAGSIAETLCIPNSSLSFHLGQLSRAGLIRQQRHHRSIIYTADRAGMDALVGYLVENCCATTAQEPEADCATAIHSVGDRLSPDICDQRRT
jgi:predicted ArsR family transcriptional regulator